MWLLVLVNLVPLAWLASLLTSAARTVHDRISGTQVFGSARFERCR